MADYLADEILAPTPGGELTDPLNLLYDPGAEINDTAVLAWHDGTTNSMPAGWSNQTTAPRSGSRSIKGDGAVAAAKLYNRVVVPVTPGDEFYFQVWAFRTGVGGTDEFGLRAGVEWQNSSRVSLGVDTVISAADFGPSYLSYQKMYGSGAAPIAARYARFFYQLVSTDDLWYVDDPVLMRSVPLSFAGMMKIIVESDAMYIGDVGGEENGTRLWINDPDVAFYFTGHHWFYQDNIYDIGEPTQNRPNSVYVGTKVVTPTIGANSTQQHALPAVGSDTLVLLSATQTLANKTLNNPAFTSPSSTRTALDLGAADDVEHRDITLRHIIGSGSIPTIAAGTGAGTSPTISLGATSKDIGGIIILTTGTTPTVSAIVCTITFAVAFGANTRILLSPGNNNAAALSGTSQVYVDLTVATASSFNVRVGSGGLAAGTLYRWAFTVQQ